MCLPFPKRKERNLREPFEIIIPRPLITDTNFKGGKERFVRLKRGRIKIAARFNAAPCAKSNCHPKR